MDAFPTFDQSTPVLDAFQALAQHDLGAFIYKAPGAEYLVRADRLATHLFGKDKEIPWLRKTTVLPLGRVLSAGGKWGLRVQSAPLEPTTDPSPFQSLDQDLVFQVVGAEGGRLGWFLNHETVLEPATRRVFFKCENGHRNPDPDHGTCYSCPAKIVGPVTDT
jgi:hypothetical protein